ncbi:Polyketide synthase [Teratosphaeria destructans]|uniref:Polyketide synthase n=1 Tax=Teratosphaeria destructans TaxID=418781 RepID=A0A9W7W6B6_9PEZI|nr:Polyketide synthase [Teratosphaeria destructans]
MGGAKFRQEPVAVVGFACRLPGGNHSPSKLWDFIEKGQVASNKVPTNRFNIKGHYDGSHKPGTMRPKGGMFVDVDLADFDASFFEIGGTEAIAMDPNQRQMLEVVFEGLENAGIPLEKVDGAPVACFVGSYASDYGDMQNRDAEDRPANCAIGVGRSIMANRLSYFLNAKGPSITIDTACSGSLVGLDMACRSIQSGECSMAIVATSNFYLNPDHVMDIGNVGQAHSPSALCHTFDMDADGYVKAEAVSCIIIKNLSEAIRDCDPIRAIVRGTASNSNGRTAGIASPNSDAQAAAIQRAYSNAGILNLNDTAYLECHGTGTQAGDPAEVNGAGSVFSVSRSAERPLLIGSIKSNIGHSEPAAGNSGLIKAIMAIEKGVIPGTPLFIKPSPKIDFAGNKVRAFRSAISWPDKDFPLRRASINSFGYGGSNAHAIIDQPEKAVRDNHVSSFSGADFFDDFDDVPEMSERPYTLFISANDAQSLKGNISSLCSHLLNPRVKISLPDLAYTLTERRTRLWHRAFITTRSTEIRESDFTVGKRGSNAPKISFIFTGQGAQWPQMGKDLLKYFPWTRTILQELDSILQAQPNPPSWSLLKELTEPRPAEHLRQAEFSQPLVTALQLCIVAVLESWGVKPSSVIGHSSGEIVAAYVAGLLDRQGAITAAFYRGRAAVNRRSEIETDVGMLAVGLGPQDVQPFIDIHSHGAWIACFNSPNSVTISGRKLVLESLAEDIKAKGHFARLLQVDMAYHSKLMHLVGVEYADLLAATSSFSALEPSAPSVRMFSSVTGQEKTDIADAKYWKTNMVSPVRFSEALTELVKQDSPDMAIEIGPSGALAGPVSQVLKSLPTGGNVSYAAAWSRSANAGEALFDISGRLFIAGAPIDMSVVNQYGKYKVRTITDLPNYSWNHTVKYWHENAASRDWRYKRFITHDLLGSKIPGTSWKPSTTWRKQLYLDDVPWLRDHRMGTDVLIPGAGLATMALEAMYQKHSALHPDEEIEPNDLCYRFRNVKFERAVVVEENKPTTILLTLSAVPGSKDWHEWRIQTHANGVTSDHCGGLIRVQEPLSENEAISGAELAPLKHPQSTKLWYKAQREVGMEFGPSFQMVKAFETISGSRNCRALVDLQPPESKWKPESYYPLHPTTLDCLLQTATPANAAGERSLIKATMVPHLVDDMIVNRISKGMTEGLAVAESVYTGRGRQDLAKSWTANINIHDPASGAPILKVTGLHYIKLDTGERPDPHVIQSVTWKPDITLLTQAQLRILSATSAENQLDMVLDLIAHKTPTLRVLEMSLHKSDSSTIWFADESHAAARVAYTQYHFATSDAMTLSNVQSAHESRRDSAFHLINTSKDALDLTGMESTFNLAIVKASKKGEDAILAQVLQNMQALLASDAMVVVVHRDSEPLEPQETENSALHSVTLRSMLEKSTLFSSIKEITTAPGDGSAYLMTKKPMCGNIGFLGRLTVVTFHADSPVLSSRLRSTLVASGWEVNTCPVWDLASGSHDYQDASSILVVDELYRPVLKDMQEEQWDDFKRLISGNTPVLWVTKGAQTASVTDPDNALVQGLFRVVRNEIPATKLVTLDVQSALSPATDIAIDEVLGKLQAGHDAETEYAERDGIVLVQRLLPDLKLNEFKNAESKGLEPVVKGLHATEAQVRLQAEKVGTLESLTWCETAVGEVPMEPGMIEIEVKAVGVNFKDVATTMGIVPENEYTIGCECAGIVRRVAPGVNKVNIGDRVVCMRSGTYVNRVQCPADRVHVIPDNMSLEDASTIPLVYLTAIYALYHLGNLREGQSVLIHSAAGGVGIAAIQLAQYKKADVFVTVGTNEKRDYLAKTFGIPENRMFNSRNTKFAAEIRRETGGRGVDVILNSLIGELLDESWRLTADGGIMVEIGKRDIVDRNTLAMEPFDRNCSFRAVDLSYTREITNELIGRLLEEIFDLVKRGHIGPIHPISQYRFDQVIPALSYIRRGQHIGKVVVSSGEEDPQLPIRPAVRKLQLDPDVSYLIVGGLKGLCGSLAVHMVRHGARRIIVMSRSGVEDEASQRCIAHCAAWGCEVKCVKGDVADAHFVEETFQSAQGRIAGVIQGAMVLRDKPFETMSHDDLMTSLNAKVTGTWNLHNAANRQQMPLEFFSLLSSISGVIGNKGQANYAAANAFLDAFAYYRQAKGLNANSIDLGAIRDVGYLAEQGEGMEARFDKSQWTPIDEAMLRRIFTYSILQQDRQPIHSDSRAQLVTGLAYPLAAGGSELEREPRFSYLFSIHAGGGGAGDEEESNNEMDQAIKAFMLLVSTGADAATLNMGALSVLQPQITKVLRLETEMEPAKPLSSYGLDSLSAVELRGWVRQKLGADLSTLDITNASSMTALGEKLVSKMPAPGEAKQ